MPDEPLYKEFTVCPYCGGTKLYHMRRNKYKCSACRREWARRKGTAIEHSTISEEAYAKMRDMAQEGYPMYEIARVLKHSYYTVFKLCYDIAMRKATLNKKMLLDLKKKTQETHFSIAQNTGLSISVVAKLMSSVRKYRVNPKYYRILYEYLYTLAYAPKKEPLPKIEDTAKPKTFIPVTELFMRKRHVIYASDILICANRIGSNAFTASIPEKFFYDYYYKTCVHATSMKKILMTLKSKGYIATVNGAIYRANYPLKSLTGKKGRYLTSSLAQYCAKTGNYPLAFGWALLGEIKQRSNEYLFHSICYYERKNDTEALQQLVEAYEARYRRTSTYIYALLLYVKLYISIRDTAGITKNFKLMRLFLRRIGVFSDKPSPVLAQQLEYEIHSAFIFFYTYFKSFGCINITLCINRYYLYSSYGHDSKYIPYHLIVPFRYYIDTNDTMQYQEAMKMLQTVKLSTVSEQNTYYVNFLFYYITIQDQASIDKYVTLLECNGTESISLKNLLLRYELLCLLLLRKKKYGKALAWALQWYNEQHKNQIDALNILLYIRISLQFCKGKSISTGDPLFFAMKGKKTSLGVRFDGMKALKGLGHLLKLCRVNLKTSTVTTDDVIQWLDNYMTVFRQCIYTKHMLRSSTGRFIRKIRKIDASVAGKSLDEFIPVLKSLLSYNPKKTSQIRIPLASSSHLITVHSLNYAIYEHLFLRDKTVSLHYPPVMPTYISDILAQE